MNDIDTTRDILAKLSEMRMKVTQIEFLLFDEITSDSVSDMKNRAADIDTLAVDLSQNINILAKLIKER